MSIWICRECKRAFHQNNMLPGWNGLWCPNCVWNEVVPAAALTAPGAATGAAPASDTVLPGPRS